jgi:transcriptional regulator with XRE-family HTH domain
LSKSSKNAPKSPVAARIQQARERVGLSQRKLGLAIDLDPSVASSRINHYERERHAPNFAIVSKIAAATGFPEGFFYTPDNDLAELTALLGGLNATNRRRVRLYLTRLQTPSPSPSKSA